MPVNSTFEQLLKSKLIDDLGNYIVDRTFTITNDINMYALGDFLGTEVLATISTGNGTPVDGNSKNGVVQPILMRFACPLNYLQTFLSYLTDYIKAENQLDLQELPETGTEIYYFKSNYNTPAPDTTKYSLGGFDYIEVIVSGSFFYGLYEPSIDSISIGASSLTGIISVSGAATPDIERHIIGGLGTVLLNIGYSMTKTIRIEYNSGDTLHATLKGYIDDPTTIPAYLSVTINSETHNMIATLNESKNGLFTYIDITLQRTELYE